MVADFSDAKMIPDQYGYLHAFWMEKFPPDDQVVVQYARFDGEIWSSPLDIVTAPPGAYTIGDFSATVDQRGWLHLVFTGGNTGPVYYSQAPAFDALSAKNWSKPTYIDIPAYQARVVVDSKQTIHLLFSNFYGVEPGMYYTRSKDNGINWSGATWLDPDIPDQQAPGEFQFALDPAGGLHAVWHYLDMDENTEVSGGSVRYAHSPDGGDTWSLPIEIDAPDETSDEVRMARPGLAVKDQTVHIIWAGTEKTNREHRFSSDAGRTWSVPVQIFGELHGQAAGDGLAVDAAGRVHFASNIRYPLTIWHAYWDQDHWSALSPVTNAFPNAHYVRLAVRAGNQLVVTFRPTSSHDAPLYAMHRMLDDVSPLPVKPTPQILLTPTPGSQSSPSPTPLSPTPTATTRPSTFAADAPPPAAPHPAEAIVVSVMPALLVVGSVVMFYLVRKRHLG